MKIPPPNIHRKPDQNKIGKFPQAVKFSHMEDGKCSTSSQKVPKIGKIKIPRLLFLNELRDSVVLEAGLEPAQSQ